ncbi:hypothetical protein FKP32DRAFT_363647 [Trametes sanguinea]|nr:hypothetical protein FKP32DRAFT_363647 [Trametes sanguinea]
MSATTMVKPQNRSVQVFFDRSPSANRDSAERTAIRATIITLFDPDSNDQALEAEFGTPFAVLPSDFDQNSVPQSIQDYLKELTVTANAAAASLACGSILAGHASEADEFGDIAFWLGDGDYTQGHERDVLIHMDLGHLMQQDVKPQVSQTQSMCWEKRLSLTVGQYQTVEISQRTGLPTTVHVPASPSSNVSRFRELLGKLSACRVFCVHGGLSVYILLGRYEAERHSGWAGLLGLGVES